ncbi:hypothetical protein [Methanobrevibacter sp.]|uniref:hypothetical protein n=1 Tax=Methanobrevibacter sp. TaxID=66852 RepID=UPI0038649C54
MSEKEFDIDEEIKKLSRKSTINMRKSEYAFENQIRKLDKDIDDLVKRKIKNFESNKRLMEDYLTIDYSESSIERYREKLKKI